MATQTFDDRDGWIWLDGQMVEWREAKVHVLTHALHYASAVFEGERAYGGHIFKSSDHSRRLRDSARILDFEVPWSVAEIDAAKAEVLKRNHLVNAYVRPIAWRGSEMMGVSAQHNKIHLGIAVWDWPSYFDPAQRMKGIRLDIADYRRPDPATAPALAKAAGLYMICTISKHRAERRGYADALMLDWQGRVAECTGANIFFVKNGVIHTPIADCFLAGITRATVIDLARKRGFEVIERRILPEELGDFDECFITGTAAEVTPVGEIGPHAFKPGAVTAALARRLYRRGQSENQGRLTTRGAADPNGSVADSRPVRALQRRRIEEAFGRRSVAKLISQTGGEPALHVRPGNAGCRSHELSESLAPETSLAPRRPLSLCGGDKTVHHQLSARLVEVDGQLGAIDGDNLAGAEFAVNHPRSRAGRPKRTSHARGPRLQ